jgi:hypothetical protein
VARAGSGPRHVVIALMDGPLAMAWTAIDLATDEAQRRRLVARA